MPFELETLRAFKDETPFFVFDEETLIENYKKYKAAFPQNTEICYAMKSNSEKEVLEILRDRGSSFEVASKYELHLLRAIGVKPENIIYGTAVKPESHISEFASFGVDRFAFDSEEELRKIQKYSPKARVYVRTLVDDQSDSVFHMSEKFGAPINDTVDLLIKAKEWGLHPYGISFNVGSQARNAEAWARGINDLKRIMEKAKKHGIEIEILNLGGGFPYQYRKDESFPTIEEIASHINEAIKDMPHAIKYIAEPGRGLVADAFALITTVIGKNMRANGHWLYIDAGVYNAFLEAMASQGSTRYRLQALRDDHSSKNDTFILTGPTGDNLDVIHQEAVLPSDIKVGDKIVVYDVGAYTFPLITAFNGFPKPEILLH